MPKIATYEAPESIGLRPTETGINAVAGAARRIQGNYNEAAAAQSDSGSAFKSAITTAGDVAVKYMESREVSAGSAAYTTMYANMAKAWDDVAKNADPNDPTVGQKFIEGAVEPELEKFKSAFLTEHGQKWAESHVASLRQHMGVRTTADMSTLAAKAAEMNVRQTVNALSNAVQSDPASLDFALGTIDTTTGGLIDANPNMRGAEAAKLKGDLTQKAKENIVKAAAFGYMEKTGGQMPPWVEEQRFAQFMPPGELKQFQQAAKFYERAAKSEADADARQQKHAEDEQFNNARNKIELETLPQTDDASPTLPPGYWNGVRELAKMPGADRHPGAVKTMIDNGDRLARRLGKPEPLSAVSNATAVDLIGKIRRGEITSTEDIYDAYEKQELSKADFKFVTDEFKNLRTADGQRLGKTQDELMKAVKPLIDKSNPLMGKMDQDGPLNLYRFEWDMKRRIDEYRKDGKNPYDLFDPAKPDYLGRPEALQQYQKPLQQSISDQARRLGGGASAKPATGGSGAPPTAPPAAASAPALPPRKPGESSSTYMKRIGMD